MQSEKNLFSFILDLYSIICDKSISEISVINNIWDFSEYTKENKFHTFESFAEFLDEKQYWKLLSPNVNFRFATAVLQYLDSEIYAFKEYDDLFLYDNKQIKLENVSHYLIVLPENYPAKQINKIFNQKNKKGLRKIRQYNPIKICNILGLRNLNFVEKKEKVIIEQFFCKLPNLAADLTKDYIDLGFYPFIKIQNDAEPLLKISYSTDSFTITVDHKKYCEQYIDYLLDALKSKSSIIILPENSIAITDYSSISRHLNSLNLDSDKLVVAGTLWNDYKNTQYVFNDDGDLLIAQEKFTPFVYCENGNKYYEDLKKTITPHYIKLLHIKSFGLFGFPICSDLTNEMYIESIYCDCKVTNLIVPCMSKSNDIFSSFEFLSSHYHIAVFACNSNIGKNNLVGFCSLPCTKNISKRSCKTVRVFSKHSKPGKCIKGIYKRIKLKICTKP